MKKKQEHKENIECPVMYFAFAFFFLLPGSMGLSVELHISSQTISKDISSEVRPEMASPTRPRPQRAIEMDIALIAYTDCVILL